MYLSSHLENKNKATGFEDRTQGQAHATLIDEKQWLYIQRRYQMSPREVEVAKLVCRGLTNEDIAHELHVKSGTVKTHLRSIFGKTRARSKIKMLLTLIDDAMVLSTEPDRAPIPILETDKNAEGSRTRDDILKEE
ncbi:MAG: response regulator transcription factor [Planctomycetota bacterium]|jgi:DNA-binding NarL/FixJ family response regulator